MVRGSGTVRAARAADLPAVVAVQNAVDVATLGEPDTTETDVAAGWDESTFDLESDAFVAEVDGRVVGYAEVYDRSGDRADLEIDVYAHPGVAPDGTTEALLERALARAGAMHPGARLSTWLPVGDGAVRAYEAAGFTGTRHFLRMRIATADAVRHDPPRTIEIRPLLPGIDERAVHAVLVDAFAAHVRPPPASFERFEERTVHHPDYDPELWALAWNGERPVGAITVFDYGDIGFIQAVGVVPEWRGRGVAAALISHALHQLAARGEERCDLGVDVEDPVGALRLYERIGFHAVQDLVLYERAGTSEAKRAT